ncbi:MAG: dihydrodipicolinate synthase family protein, partial [Bacteroidota bacterium]|nr:dihydrodipicolinate synthase family protein [Bacteroidota bacterium]
MNRKTFLATIGAAALGPSLYAVPPKATMPRPAVIPAALTPYDDDLRVDLAEFRRHIAALAAVPGVTGIMVNGGAGHDSTLTRDERRRLVAEALAAAGDRVRILAALREANDFPTLAPFAKDAAVEGAHALIVMPPAKKADEAWD